MLKQKMKCSTIQCENVNRGHVASILTAYVQNSVLLHGYKPVDLNYTG